MFVSWSGSRDGILTGTVKPLSTGLPLFQTWPVVPNL